MYPFFPLIRSCALLCFLKQDRGSSGPHAGVSGYRELRSAPRRLHFRLRLHFIAILSIGVGLDARAGGARAARLLAPARARPAASPRNRRDSENARVEVRPSAFLAPFLPLSIGSTVVILLRTIITPYVILTLSS